jgi:hypothetical protein
MYLSRLCSVALVFGIAVGATIIACGNSGGSTNKSPDAKVFLDSAPMQMDAPTSSGNALAQSCTPSSSNPQGDCPAGYTCLSLTGGTHPWCSKTCTAGSGDMCGVGYTGTGLAACFYRVTVGSGSAQDYCGVICQDQTMGNMICSTTQCNGTCPSSPPLACAAQLQGMGSNGSAVNVAKGCQ